VDLHRLADVLVAALLLVAEPRAPGRARVVHEQVEAPVELPVNPRAHLPRRVLVREIERQVRRADVARELREAVLAPGDEQQLPAFPREQARRGLADAARGAGHDGVLHASTFSTTAAVSRAMRDRGTTTSNPACSARRRVS